MENWTFFAALAIDWVLVSVRPLPPFSICLFLQVLMDLAADHMLGLTLVAASATLGPYASKKGV
jgi:hypothetical protein